MYQSFSFDGYGSARYHTGRRLWDACSPVASEIDGVRPGHRSEVSILARALGLSENGSWVKMRCIKDHCSNPTLPMFITHVHYCTQVHYPCALPMFITHVHYPCSLPMFFLFLSMLRVTVFPFFPPTIFCRRTCCRTAASGICCTTTLSSPKS